jgi:cell division protein FtsA
MANKIITAIDIGSSKVCTVIASVTGNDQPSVIGVSSVPSRGLKKGVIVNIDEAINSIADSLEAAERMAGLTVSSVYISINGKHITSTNNKGVIAVAQDEIMTDDVYRAIESARTVSIPPSREILHVIPREFIVDAQGGIKDPVGMSGMRLEVDAHIVSATSTAIHNLIKCVQQLGLRVEDIVFSGWSAATSTLTETEKELGVMLLDIGGGTTSVITFVEDAITYSGSVPFGGTNVTSDLAIGLRVSLEDAERIKLNIEELIKKERKTEDEDKDKKEKKKDIIDVTELNVDGSKTISKKLFNEITEARMTEIFELVKTQITQSGNESELPAGVVITGGGALLPGITKMAQEVFDNPARVGYPKGLGGLVDEISEPTYAVAQGLVIYGDQDDAEGSTQVGGKKEGGENPMGKIMDFFKSLMP